MLLFLCGVRERNESALNNSVLWRNGANMQLLEHQPDVVAHAAQHRMQRIAKCALKGVSSQPAVHFHVSNGGLDSTAPLDHRLHGPGNAPALP